MPFDGVVTKNIADELRELLVGSRIEKIFQPEADEIIINIHTKQQNVKLLLSASASYPRIHITDVTKENPPVPPVFCMLLRKHITGGKITGIEFHDFERIISILIEAVSELGDLTYKKLVIEIMGRYSNIILVNDQEKIIDAIKHIDSDVSSVREVMPARPYVLPPSQNKASIWNLDIPRFMEEAANSTGIKTESYLLDHIKGFSPLLCRELCYRSGIDPKMPVTGLPQEAADNLIKHMEGMSEDIQKGNFMPCIIYGDRDSRKPLDFHSLEVKQSAFVKYFDTMNQVLDIFYAEKDRFERFKQKTADLVKVIHNNIDRCNKKIAIHNNSLRDVADREKLRLYGELLTANIYRISGNQKSVSLQNYYSENNELVKIPLDENLSPQQNAQRYFKKYTKAKVTFEYASRQLEETLKELEYLESVQHLLNNCSSPAEIDEVRQELSEQGYIQQSKKGPSRKKEQPSSPLYFKSSDGFDIYVGKNNRQNDQLTLKQAASNDVWFHARNIPGSHVVIKKLNRDIPDRTLLEAAGLAAFHSKAQMSANVPVDYTTVKNVKKPSGAKPGMVIYENFKTLIVTPDESLVNRLKQNK